MPREVASGEEPTVEKWVKSFDTAVQNFGKTSDLLDSRHRKARLNENPSRATCGNEFVTQGM
jgi:hypothetical protein